MGGFDFSGLSGLLTAGAALIGAYAATYKATTGKRSERRNQAAANELTADDQTNRHYLGLVETLNRQLDRERAEIDRQDVLLAHKDDVIRTLQGVVNNEIAQRLAEDGLDAGGLPRPAGDPDDPARRPT